MNYVLYPSLERISGIKHVYLPLSNEDRRHSLEYRGLYAHDVVIIKTTADSPVDYLNIKRLDLPRRSPEDDFISLIIRNRLISGMSSFLESQDSYGMYILPTKLRGSTNLDSYIPVSVAYSLTEIDPKVILLDQPIQTYKKQFYLPSFNLVQEINMSKYRQLEKLKALSVIYSYMDDLHCPVNISYGTEYREDNMLNIISMLNAVAVELSMKLLFDNNPVIGKGSDVEIRPINTNIYTGVTFILEFDDHKKSITLTKKELFGIDNECKVKNIPWMIGLINRIIKLDF